MQLTPIAPNLPNWGTGSPSSMRSTCILNSPIELTVAPYYYTSRSTFHYCSLWCPSSKKKIRFFSTGPLHSLWSYCLHHRSMSLLSTPCSFPARVPPRCSSGGYCTANCVLPYLPLAFWAQFYEHWLYERYSYNPSFLSPPNKHPLLYHLLPAL